MEKTNQPHLTAIHRTEKSLPTRTLLKKGLLKGRILDFGCGHGVDTDELREEGYDIVGYDNYYRAKLPTGKFDTIICHYVLNVLERAEQTEVLMQISELLKPSGNAYFSVRRDLKDNIGFRFHHIHKAWTYQTNVVLPYTTIYKNTSFEIYQYQHFNQVYNKEKGNCPYFNISHKLCLVSESASSVAFYETQYKIIVLPKRKVSIYSELSQREQIGLKILTNRCSEILQKNCPTSNIKAIQHNTYENEECINFCIEVQSIKKNEQRL